MILLGLGGSLVRVTVLRGPLVNVWGEIVCGDVSEVAPLVVLWGELESGDVSVILPLSSEIVLSS